MSNEIRIPPEADEEILALDVADDALERAAGVADAHAITWGFCTDWYHCRWPS